METKNDDQSNTDPKNEKKLFGTFHYFYNNGDISNWENFNLGSTHSRFLRRGSIFVLGLILGILLARLFL